MGLMKRWLEEIGFFEASKEQQKTLTEQNKEVAET